jgi:acyl-CoA synthetase (NDP forming)
MLRLGSALRRPVFFVTIKLVVISTDQELLREFESIFYPRSIAVVGISQNLFKVGSVWVKALIDAGFKGPIYPIHPRGGEFLGLKVYTNIKQVPGVVDYVIVSIPRAAVPQLLDDCAHKVKAVHFFTAGFGEAGDAEGRQLEGELIRKARQGGFRIIGPNCIGVYSPEARVPYGLSGRLGEVGSVGFISQSGGIGEKLFELGIARSIKYNKGISFGNGIDLDSPDYIEYMAADPRISVIGAYLEGTKNGSRLFRSIKAAARSKPLVIWKAGRTDVGAAAAASHTGSLASSAQVWSAALRQCGAIEVRDVEELTDTLLIFQQLGRLEIKGHGIAVVGGLADGGGGISVSASDACAELGLNIPPLSPATGKKLTSLLGRVGSILRNPVDVSQSGSNRSVIKEATALVLADPLIDLVIVQIDAGILLRYFPWELVEPVFSVFIELRTEQQKPIVVVSPPGASEPQRIEMEKQLTGASIPVFPTMKRAAQAIANLSQYSRFQHGG